MTLLEVTVSNQKGNDKKASSSVTNSDQCGNTIRYELMQ